MSTATATDTVVTRESINAQYGQPPAGHKWKTSGKGATLKLILGDDGNPIAVKKAKKNKKSRPMYTVPDGGFVTSETPGFVVGEHKKLVLANFQDPLNYSLWNVWFCQQSLERANKDVENMKALGSTPEARKANIDASKAMASIENFVAKQKASGVSNSVMQERLAKLLAEMSVG